MEPRTTSELVFFVNGKKVVEQNPDPEWTLAYFLRNKLRLCGTKESCGEGGCGACTVMLSKFNRKNGKILNSAINSCLTPLVSVHGCAIVTVEGIGNTRDGLHPVQERIAKSHGTQCGFCTPGFVMSMYTLLRNNETPTERELEDNFQGNLCRCTGYRPILEGFKTFCKSDENCSNGGSCCKESSSCNGETISNGCCQKYRDKIIPGTTTTLYDETEFKPYHPSQDPIFPPALKVNDTLDQQELMFTNERVKWFKPNSLQSGLELKSKYLDCAVFVAGNTALGIDAKFKGKLQPVYIQINGISELTSIEEQNDTFVIGSASTFAQLSEFCKSQSGENGNIISVLKQMLESFAGPQIRNTATIGGNIICANPSSQLNTILVACGAEVTLQSQEGRRTVQLTEEFFVNTPPKILKATEIIKSITIPNTKKNEFIWFAKQSRRKAQDLAIVNCCMKITICPESQKITQASLVYGGVGSTTKMARLTSDYLTGRHVSGILVDEVFALLDSDFAESVKTMEGMHAYRLSLIKSFFFKFALALTTHLVENGQLSQTNKNSSLNSLPCKWRPCQGSQLFEIRPDDQPLDDLVGRPFAHLSALRHATGEAVYVNDIPFEDSHLVGSFVYSTKALAKLVSIDASEALALEGVVDFFDAKNVTAGPVMGFSHDENVFADNQVTCVGQVLGFIVARDQMTADRGVRLVKVEYEELSPPILTIEDAVKHESYLDKESCEFGNVEKAFENCKNILEGEMRVGGQEHFYMETQSCLVIPKEEDELEVIASTQSAKEVQLAIAEVIGIPANRVIVRTKRVGGAFGGKEYACQRTAVCSAIAAYKLRVPVRCILNRREDMESTGTRHPALIRFKVGFDETGRIQAIQQHIYLNGGCTLDFSGGVLRQMMLIGDLAYNVPNWKFVGFACKTNLPSNTAFRGFGGPQACITMETIIDKVAEILGNCTAEKVREMHLYNEGDKTPFGHVLDYCTIRRCWEECLAKSNFSVRKLEVDKFNRENKWKKRGISVTPTRHNVGVHIKCFNQAAAMVMVYLDGSVSLSHGGIEIGQGLHTKMIQIASRVLQIPVENIYITDTSTDKIPNSTPTVASVSSDYFGMAVLRACEKLKKRLQPYVKVNPTGKWSEWVKAAYIDQTNLAATGFYKLDIGYDFKTHEGCDCNYVCFGVACSEVEVDILTGDHTVLRTDIVMDVGESLNPAIDVGQIEGGFMQGYGLFTLEEHIYSREGHLLTNGPGSYKIPSVSDIPREFHISLLRGAPNPKAIFSSKAVGEPPLFLAASVFFAIKEAIRTARIDIGLSPIFQLDSPATVERIRLACGDTLNGFTKN